MPRLLSVLLSLIFIGRASAQVAGVTDTEIKFGSDSHQTGPLAGNGVLNRSLKAYFETVNEKGGVAGRKIQYIIGDSAGGPAQALLVVKKQVDEDKVFAILGSFGAPHRAVAGYLRGVGVPDLMVADPQAIYAIPLQPLSFLFTPHTILEGTFFGEMAAAKSTTKKIGVIWSSTDAGKDAADAFKKAAGDKVQVFSESVDIRTDPSAKAQVLNLKRAGCDVVYVFAPGSTPGVAMKFAREQGFKPQWLIYYLATASSLASLAGKEAAEGAIGYHFVHQETDVDIPGVKQHLDFMKARLPNEKPSALTMMGQAIGELTVEALKRTGKNLTRQTFLATLEGIKDFQCSVCRTPGSFSSSNHLFNSKISLLVMKNGKWEPLKN